MAKKLLFFLVFFSILNARSCYSILTDTGLFTPVYPYNFTDNLNYKEDKCELLSERITWDTNRSYVGCYKSFKDANYTLHHLKFNFKNPEIVKHKISLKDQYVIFPTNSHVKPKNIDAILEKYKPQKLLKHFPTKFYGNGIDYLDIAKISFMPSVNLYDIYRYYNKHNLSRKIIILYNGVYSLEYLYKKINNSNVIEKKDNNTYVLKRAIYVSPTAKLVINNKKVLMESTPKPIFIMYHGNFYAKNSKFIAWNIKTDSFDKREYIPEEELLLIGLQKPRPYIIGLAGSKTYFINNLFEGLGFHSTTASFGVAQIYFPKDLVLNKYTLLSFLNSRGLPSGYYIGNTMRKNMMGYYCSEAKNTVLVGNLMYDNLIYDIDPHDYSHGLIIARNITAKAKHAHGIVISRQVNNTIIAQNMSFNNHSAGIMLDRLSNHNLIYDNLTFLNGYMGVSIQESDDVLIYKNKIIGNKIDGIIIRNSLKNSIKDNLIVLNGKNGVEVLSKDISKMIYRDFARDPYHLATSAVVENNKILNNIFYGVSVKNNAAIHLKQNEIKSKYFPEYGGELNIFVSKINANKGNFKLYGIGRPFIPISSDLRKISFSALKMAIKVLLDASCYNDYVSEVLAKIYLTRLKNHDLAIKEYARGISLLNVYDMYSYGFYVLSRAKTKNEYLYALSYIAQSAIFGNEQARRDLAQLIYIVPVSKNDINEAFELALNRLKRYEVIDKHKEVSCELTPKRKAKIESAWKIFEYDVKVSGAKDYYSFCKLSLKNYTLFTPSVIKKIYALFRKANEPKKAYHRRLLKENEIIKDTEACKLVAIRLKRIGDSLNQYYNTNFKKVIKEVEPYIDKYLEKVNEFRIQKVPKEKVYELMQESK